jgi:hypothetical protein
VLICIGSLTFNLKMIFQTPYYALITVIHNTVSFLTAISAISNIIVLLQVWYCDYIFICSNSPFGWSCSFPFQSLWNLGNIGDYYLPYFLSSFLWSQIQPSEVLTLIIKRYSHTHPRRCSASSLIAAAALSSFVGQFTPGSTGLILWLVLSVPFMALGYGFCFLRSKILYHKYVLSSRLRSQNQ